MFRGRTHWNHNRLLQEYEGTDGIKTGYVNDSGFNLVASAQRDGVRLVAAVFGGRTGRERDRHMMTILDRGFAAMGVAPRDNDDDGGGGIGSAAWWRGGRGAPSACSRAPRGPRRCGWRRRRVRPAAAVARLPTVRLAAASTRSAAPPPRASNRRPRRCAEVRRAAAHGAAGAGRQRPRRGRLAPQSHAAVRACAAPRGRRPRPPPARKAAPLARDSPWVETRQGVTAGSTRPGGLAV